MLFSELWDLSFDLLNKLILFFEQVIDVLTSPVRDFAYGVIPNSLIGQLIKFLDFFGVVDTNQALLSLILTSGTSIIIIWGIVKFFTNLF